MTETINEETIASSPSLYATHLFIFDFNWEILSTYNSIAHREKFFSYFFLFHYNVSKTHAVDHLSITMSV